MSALDWILLIVVAAAVILAIRGTVRARKKGGGCGCGCSGGSACAACGKCPAVDADRKGSGDDGASGRA
ncbi:MAG: FeoB-associated Cys-rich membrane protein [Oscillospiraceae bacterium]|nr:FeoB-associated Cys-rich membrane protein [Oscillospiraceae bacterium]